MTIDKSKALFDPGFNPILNHFIPVYMEFLSVFNSTNKPANKKKLYLVNAPLLKSSLKSTVGFWKGCMLWALWLKYHFNLNPQPIEGNTMLSLDDKEISFINKQNEIIENYFNNYSSDVKRYLGVSAQLPSSYRKIFDDYRQFTEMNNHFISVKMTNELKLPETYNKEYSNEQMENLFNSVQEIIDKKDLSLFIELNF